LSHARTIVCTAFGDGDDLVVADQPTPDPGPGRVPVVVKAAGASFVDGLQAAGRYQFALA
jgi:NADPH2:quinone reductase